MTIQEALTTTTQQLLSLYAPETAPSIALWIVGWITFYDQASLITRRNEELSHVTQTRLRNLMHAHLHEHKPLPYIFQTIPFLSLDLTLQEPLLIPRSETEYWCSWLINSITAQGAPQLTMLDLCCGSGCIGLSLAQAFPRSTVYAVDDSALACAVTTKNAQKYTLSSFHCIQSNLYEALPSITKFDIIVSNPPYISIDEWHSLEPSVKHWEDRHALVADNEGLALIAAIIDQAPLWLSPTPLCPELPQLVIECGYQQGPSVKALCEKAGFYSCEVRKDPAGNDRFVTAHYKGGS